MHPAIHPSSTHQVTKTAALALIGTGASASFMSAKYAEDLGLRRQTEKNQHVTLADGSNTRQQGTTPILSCLMDEFLFKHRF
jgi:hypothetical protein